MRVRRAGVVLAVGGLGGALGVAGLSWACTAQLSLLTPQSGAPGSNVTVKGGEAARQGRVALRWNDVNGAEVGATTADANGNFAAVVRIPDVAPATYSLVAVPEGSVASPGRLAFDVTPAPGSQPVSSASSTSNLWGRTDDAQPARAGSRPGLAVGMGFLAFGTAALFSGAAVATVRRRQPATVSRSTTPID